MDTKKDFKNFLVNLTLTWKILTRELGDAAQVTYESGKRKTILIFQKLEYNKELS